MALTVTHAYVSAIPDSGDTSIVQPTNWNANHGLTGVLDVANGGTGIASFGTGIATFLGTPTSANLAAALTDETGSGAAVFATSPTFVMPILGTPQSGNLANCTGYPVGAISPAGSGTEIQYRNSTAFGAMAGTAWDNTNRSLTMTGATVTTSNPVLNMTQTWNAAGVVFTGLKLNVTNMASASGSAIFDFQLDGGSAFKYDKSGVFIVGNLGGTVNPILSGTGNLYLGGNAGAGICAQLGTTGLMIINGDGSANNFFGFQSSQFANADVGLTRTVAHRMAIMDPTTKTNATGLSVYNTWTNSSNYERAVFDWSINANLLTIDVEVGGTGTQRVISLRHLDAATGAGTPTFAAANCPAVTLTSPYTWIKATSSDGSTVYMPAWK